MSFMSMFTPVIEMIIIAFMLNYLLSFFWNTRSMDLVLGLFAYLLIFGLSSWLNLPILQQIMYTLSNVTVVALLIIFQPELRTALSKLSFKGRRFKEITEFDRFLDQLANSTYRLAEKRQGALILLEKEDSLEEFANKAIRLNADFSSELLEAIFTPFSPLHDGAAIIRSSTILAACAILPLAEESVQLTSSMGTRHRAGLGASQTSDALVIVISEETGKVSIARDGIMTRGVKVDRFKGIIRSNFASSREAAASSKRQLFAWGKR
ncbi:MAG: TIGR00159 family protein [Chlamydiae bacterium GWC2_50_10]|nr:MAG: TIGR00159 family protein [Chlamydiae bacterium GWA2_50_15]OGN53794.1 MAG: TIGR00159 family protein [Chlamydiae bacterium GWC2_50_10]OGN55073.1 MAG: TIGR00159 family protein [Chlamydiae bacterium GWF2_49_8]OGN57779.1 MAG: TIGR00159 family protein [Chlamydiae bacterium RIFCSPHIGHO2_02_FULL_49_29]OGN63456.1 MAG: TIGR00159 family protein [Chlamydiae bacterium RIFCSPHIGHO2_12_FULL_49_32]OGN68252.1 MAG: TIGR00159 family protein [Chlamydiae bacterium RIFCSPLOWO2_02_FULL_49_12]OGN72851.1 MAG: